MNQTEKTPFISFPPVRERTLKAVLSAALVAIAYSLIDRNPCFACIGAVYGMGDVFHTGLTNGGNRFVGTVIGGVFAIPFYWLIHLSGWPVPQWIWLTVGLFLVLYVSHMFGAQGAIQPGTVVFFVVIETVVPERYLSYTIARIIDTGIGVLVSLAFSRLFPTKKEREEQAAHLAESLPQGAGLPEGPED